ncbi:hypothetical protein [Tenacibaculum maritimum]|uniref:hypothetical protein n=1 Tax=Tenacibaculum maritimum TaxID=107401 RepID=UPI003876D9D8
MYLEKDENKINKELNKLTKQELNYSLYQETEIFFSNLNIKICPHCETEVSQEKKNREKIDHTCSLCGEHSDVKKVEKEELLLKLNQIKEEKKSHKHKLTQVENNIVVHKENQKILENNIKVTYNKLVKIPSIDSDLKRLKEIEVKIEKKNKERSFYKELLEDKEELIKEEAVLSFQLTEIEKDKTPDNTELLKKLKLKKNILDKALELLAEKRIRLNKDILNKLEGLILNEVHAFGLTSIERVRINDKYDLIFTQNKIEVSFNDLNEGEKLRMKLAFYLSLIQLDIEYKTGRHPRFLIFDSPGSEEMVPEHINGLSYILKDVNSRYKDEFQIFVGTALREFSDVTDSEKTYIKGKKEFIF